MQSFAYAMFFYELTPRWRISSAGFEVGVGPSVVMDAGLAKTLTTTTAKDDVYAFILDRKGVTVHSIRNFEYRTETDFTPAYYDKTYGVPELESVDLVASYWMGPDIAHMFLSFGFGDTGFVQDEPSGQ